MTPDRCRDEALAEAGDERPSLRNRVLHCGQRQRGSVGYWQARVHLSIFIGAAALTTLYVARHDPALLARLLKGGPGAETRAVEKLIVFGVSASFIALPVVSALDHRYRWSFVESQRVISTGPYAVVRHPMYASALLYLAGMPLALGSYWGLVPVAAMLPLLVWRLFDEETLLAASLPGYREYQRQVRHRLIPGMW